MSIYDVFCSVGQHCAIFELKNYGMTKLKWTLIKCDTRRSAISLLFYNIDVETNTSVRLRPAKDSFIFYPNLTYTRS